MSRRASAGWAALVAILATNAPAGIGSAAFVPGRLLARFHTQERPVLAKSRAGTMQTGIAAVDKLNSRFGCRAIEPVFVGAGKDPLACSLGLDRVYCFELSDRATSPAVLSKIYSGTGAFEYVEPDRLSYACGRSFVPNDKYFYRQWPLHNDGTFTMSGRISPKAGADISMIEAWDIERGDSSIIIAILDSGCKMDHPELAGRIWRNKKEIAGNGIDDDGNGYVDDVNGWDFVNNDADPTDDNGHGTAVAGIIGANANNSIGFAGVNLRSKLMIVKVLDSLKTGNTLGFSRGTYYAVQTGSKVLNHSYGSKNGSPTEMAAVEYAELSGVALCAGIGNGGVDSTEYPAAYSTVLTVGATEPDDRRCKKFATSSGGSNFGELLDLVGPGNFVFCLHHSDPLNYNTYGGGTSLATAFVTGVVSLLLSQDPNKTPSQVREIIRKSADDGVGDAKEDTPGWDKYYGYGRLNAYRALVMGASQGNKLSLIKRPQCPAGQDGLLLFVAGSQRSGFPGGRATTLDGRLLSDLKTPLPGFIVPGVYAVERTLEVTR